MSKITRRKVFLVNPQTMDYRIMWEDAGFQITDNLRDADLLNFQGGHDVSPSMYGEKQLSVSYCNFQRDLVEERIYTIGRSMNKFMVGICRGGQFLNVMNGGKMWQDVSNHTRSHAAMDILTGKQYFVTSTHHQMMRPTDEGTILMVAAPSSLASFKIGANDTWKAGDGKPSTPDVEAVYYDQTKCLCFQPHPEFEHAQETRRIFMTYVDECYQKAKAA